MDIEVNYAGITRRAAACIIDEILFITPYVLLLLVLSRETLTSYDVLDDLLVTLTNIPLEVLMIIRLGWTLGQFLCGTRIKDANTLGNVSLIQVLIRSILVEIWWFLLFDLIVSILALMALIVALIAATFDQRKQFFYDKIVKTVVVNYRS